MTLIVKHIFANPPAEAVGEALLTLFENDRLKVERIVSHAHSSPPGFWYDQREDEWVLVLRGSATLEFPGGELLELKCGDYLTIPSHVKHRVARTSTETIWLAIHVK